MTLLQIVDDVRDSIAKGIGYPLDVDDVVCEPTTFVAGTLYAWPSADRRIVEAISGNDVQVRHEFEITLAAVIAGDGEEAALLKDDGVTAIVREIVHDAAARIGVIRSGSSWDYLQFALDPDYLAGFEGRGITFRAWGWKLEAQTLEPYGLPDDGPLYLPVPDGYVAVTGAEPLDPATATLYEWIAGADRRELHGPVEIETFDVRALYLVDDGGESAAGTVTRDVTVTAEAHREAVIAAALGAVLSGAWGRVVVQGDAEYLQRIGRRGISLRLQGGRCIGV